MRCDADDTPRGDRPGTPGDESAGQPPATGCRLHRRGTGSRRRDPGRTRAARRCGSTAEAKAVAREDTQPTPRCATVHRRGADMAENTQNTNLVEIIVSDHREVEEV